MSEHERDEEGKLKTPQGQGEKTAKRVINVIHELVTKGNKDSETNESNKEDTDEYEGLSKEELAQKLSERETQLGQISLKAFTEEVKEVKKAMKKQFDKDVEIEDPRELEAYKKLLGESETEEDDMTEEEKRHAGILGLDKTGGKARLPSKGLQSGFERGSQIIDTLYNAIDEERYNRKYNPEKFDSKRLQEAERKVDKIWGSLKKGFVKRNYQLMPQGSRRSIWTCPKCSTSNLDTMTCSNPQCDYKVPETEAQWHKIR